MTFLGSKKWCLLAVAVPLLAAAGEEPSPAWPVFLPPPEGLPPEVTAAVRRVWSDPTFSRTVRGRPARAPFSVYMAFVDSPDVTAAAARFRDLAPYEVRPVGPDWYEADDRDGARGFYRVLVREGSRRVILSWGEHSSAPLGTIRGSAVSILHFEARDGTVEQVLTAHVRIDNRFAAVLARIFIVLFGAVADRKLTEGFEVTAEVVEWAMERPDEFCGWLSREPLPLERREPVLRVLPACR